ncbi:MAG: T9SS type A sorting domain-containing protein [Bacteroidetes bacterium]|nr:T9SS type A sorting domain-containing protein [Bacteroidota bacterium]
MKRLVLFASLLLSIVAGTTRAQWTSAPPLPVVLDWPMTAQVNGTIYVFGGIISDGNSVSKNVYSYTPGDAAWKKLSVTMPKAKFGGYAEAVGGKIYITAGMTTTAQTGLDNSTFVFDPAASTFTSKAAITTKTAWCDGATVDGKLYVMGGIMYNGGQGYYVTAVQIYDPASDAWTTATTPVPYNAQYSSSFGLNGKIYMIGGVDNTGYLTSVWQGVSDGTDVTWTQVADLPDGLARASAGSVGGKLIVASGISTASSTFTPTYVYDDAADKWSKTYALAGPIYNAGQLVTVGSNVYIMGGYSNTLVYSLTYPPTQTVAVADITTSNSFLTLSQNESRTLTYAATNLGAADLNVTIAIPDSVKAWVSPVSSPETIPAATNGTYGLTINAGTLSPGLHKATISMTTNDNAHPSYSFDVRLYVLPSTITPQKTKVVLEEGTGSWCGYCPQGHEISKSIVDQYNGDVIALQYHGGGAVDTFIISAGQNLINDLGLQGYPNASIQRWHFPGEQYQMTNRGQWAGYVQNVFDQQPKAPVGLTITDYSFDPTTHKVHAVVDVAQNMAMINTSSTINLTAVISEDNMVVNNYQEDYRLPSPYFVDTYTWEGTVHQLYPNEFGKAVTFDNPTIVDGDVIVPGSTKTMTLDFTVPSKGVFDWANCNITFIASVVNSDNTFGDVLQASQRPLLSGAGVHAGTGVTGFTLEGNYPNPVQGETKIVYSLDGRMPVSLAVYDVLGRKVAEVVNTTQDAGSYTVNFDASKLTTGTYTYSLTAGEQKLTRTMNVIK